jgi:deoxyribose-phosphate aldolase
MQTLTLIDIPQLVEQYEVQAPAFELPAGHPGTRPVTAWIDHTLLKPEAAPRQVEQLCDEALQAGFAAVCVNPIFVKLAAGKLTGSPVKVCTVVGFPLGATICRAKVAETRFCLEDGAREIDMVLPIGLLKAGELEAVFDDIQSIVGIAHSRGVLVKVIMETALLTRPEKTAACLLSKLAGADFVKTSTGFSTGGATLEDVEWMRRVVGPEMGVKAAGGVRSLADARAMLSAGATRLGTSAGMKIYQELGV